LNSPSPQHSPTTQQACSITQFARASRSPQEPEARPAGLSFLRFAFAPRARTAWRALSLGASSVIREARAAPSAHG
jgi:hypothetical protein